MLFDSYLHLNTRTHTSQENECVSHIVAQESYNKLVKVMRMQLVPYLDLHYLLPTLIFFALEIELTFSLRKGE